MWFDPDRLKARGDSGLLLNGQNPIHNGQTLNFEASGGLTNALLVMQEKQTNTDWSLMKGKALVGKMKGESLDELPIGEKTTWKQWRSKHPMTKVLSVDSRQDGRNPYKSYFQDENRFRGLEASDQRLETKTPIFAFHHRDIAYAIPYSEFQPGGVFNLSDGSQVFLFRSSDDEIFRSTSVFVSVHGFLKNDLTWTEKTTGNTFDESTRLFGNNVRRLNGFDTIWYNWSLNNPESELLNSITDTEIQKQD